MTYRARVELKHTLECSALGRVWATVDNLVNDYLSFKG